MVKTTKAQRQALKRVFDRHVLDKQSNEYILEVHRAYHSVLRPRPSFMRQYRAFRRTVQPTFCCDDCILVPVSGMWLGIERDGYTHS